MQRSLLAAAMMASALVAAPLGCRAATPLIGAAAAPAVEPVASTAAQTPRPTDPAEFIVTDPMMPGRGAASCSRSGITSPQPGKALLLEVGPGRVFEDIQQALNALIGAQRFCGMPASQSARVLIYPTDAAHPDRYLDSGKPRHAADPGFDGYLPDLVLTLEGMGDKPLPLLSGPDAVRKQKGYFIATGTTTFRNLEIGGLTKHDGNFAGAAVRIEPTGHGTITFDHVYFHDDDHGIMGGWHGQKVVIKGGSVLARNGSGRGQTHNIYILEVDELVMEDSASVEAFIGHNLKSRAAVTTVRRSLLADGPNGMSSYDLDVPFGGVVTVEDTVMHKGPKCDDREAHRGFASSNGPFIHYAGENLHEPGRDMWPRSSLALRNVTLLNQCPLDSYGGDWAAIVDRSGDKQLSGPDSHPIVPQITGLRTYGLPSGRVYQGETSPKLTITTLTTMPEPSWPGIASR
jgi:hypothetical protein